MDYRARAYALIGWLCDAEGKMMDDKLVVTHIEAFAKEVAEDALRNTSGYECGRVEGYRVAIEDAAKVVEFDELFDADIPRREKLRVCMVLERASERIRALAPLTNGCEKCMNHTSLPDCTCSGCFAAMRTARDESIAAKAHAGWPKSAETLRTILADLENHLANCMEEVLSLRRKLSEQKILSRVPSRRPFNPLHTCGTTKVRNDTFDAYFCPQCDEWLESVCSDRYCENCPGRPAKPSLTKES